MTGSGKTQTAWIVNQRTGAKTGPFADYVEAAEFRRDVLRPRLPADAQCPFAIRVEPVEIEAPAAAEPVNCARVDHGATGYCTSGRHDGCAYGPGGALARGLWVPECYVTVPPKGGRKGTSPFRENFTDGAVAALPGIGPLMVVSPGHIYRCDCDCHDWAAASVEIDGPAVVDLDADIVGQLELFAVAPEPVTVGPADRLLRSQPDLFSATVSDVFERPDGSRFSVQRSAL